MNLQLLACRKARASNRLTAFGLSVPERFGLVFSLFLTFAAVWFSAAPVQAKDFLWQVQGANTPGNMYLIGSVHVLHSYDTLPPLFNTVVDLSHKVMFEADVDDPQGDEVVRSLALLPSGDHLTAYITSFTYTELNSFLVSRRANYIDLGFDQPVHFSALKPWFVGSWVSHIRSREAGLSSSYGVDRRLLTRARNGYKTLGYLESVQAQLQAVDRSTRGTEDASIWSALGSDPENTVDLWMSKDFAALEDSINESYAEDPVATSIVLSERNASWMPAIETELYRGNYTTLIVVGAGHMPSQGGLLRRLRNRGYFVEQLPAPPRLVVQPPAEPKVAVGGTIVVNVKAMGTPPLTYRWMKNGGTIVGNGTATLRIPNAQPADAARYTVVVENGDGTSTSSAAQVRVGSPPMFTAQPQSAMPTAGSSVLLTGPATGTDPIDYQWRKNGVNIPDATNSSFAIADFQLADMAVYSLVASNSGGITVSQPATLILKGSGATSSVLVQNSRTGRRGILALGTFSWSTWTDLGVMPPQWDIGARADFNGDGEIDLLWQNPAGLRGFWLMSGTNRTWQKLTTIDPVWRIGAAGDFDGDGQNDIAWQNTATGVRLVWLMNQTNVSRIANLGKLPVAWQMVGAADFNGDGRSDSVWENTASGLRGILLTADGPAFGEWVGLGTLAVQWHIGGTGDFNGDGRSDSVWENRSTGARGVWFMNGTARIWVSLPPINPEWQMRNR
jgi:uncharacterized protein YbaP (TraB family)